MRSANHSISPSDVFLPILITTYFATLGSLIYISIRQKINLLNKTVFTYLGTITAFIGLLLWHLSNHPEHVQIISSTGSNLLLFSIIIIFFILAIRKKVNIYESFIDGAKEGFQTAISIIPYLVAMLCAIALLRASGTLDNILDGIKWTLLHLGVVQTEFIDALPVAFMKPFSGSGARALMVESFNNYGVDSFIGKLSATFQGSTETTFYVIAVYFGAVKVKNTRYAATGGIIADVIGVITAILVAYLFYK
jgi:spore maturation protein SpmB